MASNSVFTFLRRRAIICSSCSKAWVSIDASSSCSNRVGTKPKRWANPRGHQVRVLCGVTKENSLRRVLSELVAMSREMALGTLSREMTKGTFCTGSKGAGKTVWLTSPA